MKLLLTMMTLLLVSANNGFATEKDPVRSPTFPERGNPETHYFVPSTIATFNSVKVTIRDSEEGEISFIQVKNNHDGYDLYMPQTAYEKILKSRVEANLNDVQIISDEEYLSLSKQVELNLQALVENHSYIGGDGGRCAAGTIGVAIGGGLAGGAVGGPAGAIAGAIGGALAGSAANCK